MVSLSSPVFGCIFFYFRFGLRPSGSYRVKFSTQYHPSPLLILLFIFLGHQIFHKSCVLRGAPLFVVPVATNNKRWRMGMRSRPLERGERGMWVRGRARRSCWRVLVCRWSRWTNWNNHEAVQVSRTYIFKWRFNWRSRRGCVKSLLTYYQHSWLFVDRVVPGAIIGSFSNDDGDGNENVSWKCNFA